MVELGLLVGLAGAAAASAAAASAAAAPAAAAPAAAAPAPAYDSNGFRKYYEERAAVSGSGVVRPIARLV